MEILLLLANACLGFSGVYALKFFENLIPGIDEY